MAIIPNTNCGYFNADFVGVNPSSATVSSTVTRSGNEDILSNMATTKNATPKIKYGIFTLSILAVVFSEEAAPKMAKLTINGPIVVPKLFIPPAVMSRCEPVAIGPKAIANGFATVCCNEKPNPTINNPDNIKGNEPVFAAG